MRPADNFPPKVQDLHRDQISIKTQWTKTSTFSGVKAGRSGAGSETSANAKPRGGFSLVRGGPLDSACDRRPGGFDRRSKPHDEGAERDEDSSVADDGTDQTRHEGIEGVAAR